MNIYAVISNEDLQSNIINFIKLIKNINFSFVKLNEINNLKNKTVFFIIDSKTNSRPLKIIENSKEKPNLLRPYHNQMTIL